jgi:phosphate transport system substrate-binding protein
MRKLILTIISASLILYSCDNDKKKSTLDTYNSGTITISVDENYKPVIDEQIRVFKGRNPEANIIANYKPEEDCIQDLYNKKARVILITRQLTAKEKEACLSNDVKVHNQMSFLRDGVTFITSKNKPLNLTQTDLEDILKGKQDKTIVFENKKSATLRYVSDSILKGAPLSKNIFAAKGCDDLINFVNRNKNSIGVIGFSWLSCWEDSATAANLSKVNISLIKPNTEKEENYYGPYQAHLLAEKYPYARDLNFIISEGYSGLGTSFVNYLCRDGQLVFTKWKLFPLRHNIVSRVVNVKH